MNKEDFRNLLAKWALEDIYISQLTWEEGDALAGHLERWFISKDNETKCAAQGCENQAIYTVGICSDHMHPRLSTDDATGVNEEKQ